MLPRSLPNNTISLFRAIGNLHPGPRSTAPKALNRVFGQQPSVLRSAPIVIRNPHPRVCGKGLTCFRFNQSLVNPWDSRLNHIRESETLEKDSFTTILPKNTNAYLTEESALLIAEGHLWRPQCLQKANLLP